MVPARGLFTGWRAGALLVPRPDDSTTGRTCWDGSSLTVAFAMRRRSIYETICNDCARSRDDRWRYRRSERADAWRLTRRKRRGRRMARRQRRILAWRWELER